MAEKSRNVDYIIHLTLCVGHNIVHNLVVYAYVHHIQSRLLAADNRDAKALVA